MAATATFGDLGAADVKINGTAMSADLSGALNDISVDRTIDGASTITLVLTDRDRKLLRSKLLRERITLTLDGLHFVYVKNTKQGDTLRLTFEDANVNALRQAKGHVAAAAGTTTRSQFAERIVRLTPGVKINTYPEKVTARVPLTRGTSATPKEDSWTCLTRLANEVQWRCFSDGTTIWLGPDSWLLTQKKLATLRENTAGVDFIDFDFDVGKPVTSITVNCVAKTWAFPPGSPVGLADMGVATGTWLVNEMSRSLFSTSAVVTLKGPQPPLPEPT